jgi:hypothetical protein
VGQWIYSDTYTLDEIAPFFNLRVITLGKPMELYVGHGDGIPAFRLFAALAGRML